MTPEQIREAEERTVRWLRRAVLGHGLCPFARAPWDEGRVRVAVTAARTEEELLAALEAEIERLLDAPALQLETTLLVHPLVLRAFEDFNDFLDLAEAALARRGLEGVLQLASFHPGYRFAGVPDGDPGNWTNRSPHPTLHLLREASIEAAVVGHPDPDAIWRRNVERMARLSLEERERLRRGDPA